MTKSIAYWLTPSSDNQNIQTNITLHINYWLLSNTNAYLDFGVKFSDIKNWNELVFYFPFKADYESELGKKVCENPELASAIFNTHTTINDHSDSLSTLITLKGVEKTLHFFKSIPENAQGQYSVHRSEEFDGMKLTFPRTLFKKLVDGSEGYFRFRLILGQKAIEEISLNYRSKGELLTQYFESIEMVDFRINEARNLPDQIKRELNDPSCLKRVDFFLIRDPNTEYKVSHTNYIRCRLLESDQWKHYLNNTETPTQMLIYHWKEISENEQGIDHFAAFAKFTRWSDKNRFLVGVVVLMLTLNILGGLLTNWISG